MIIYGFVGIVEYVEIFLRFSGIRFIYKINFEEIELGLIFEDEMFLVIVDDFDYGVCSFGYCIVEKDK